MSSKFPPFWRKKCPKTEVNKLVREEKKIANDLGIDDRMDIAPKVSHMSH